VDDRPVSPASTGAYLARSDDSDPRADPSRSAGRWTEEEREREERFVLRWGRGSAWNNGKHCPSVAATPRARARARAGDPIRRSLPYRPGGAIIHRRHRLAGTSLPSSRRGVLEPLCYLSCRRYPRGQQPGRGAPASSKELVASDRREKHLAWVARGPAGGREGTDHTKIDGNAEGTDRGGCVIEEGRASRLDNPRSRIPRPSYRE